MEKPSSAQPLDAPEGDPLLCPECGQTPTMLKYERWRCGNCQATGERMSDGYMAVRTRYLGLWLGENAG